MFSLICLSLSYDRRKQVLAIVHKSVSKSTNFFKISHLWEGDVFLWTCLLQEEAISSKILCPVAPGLTRLFMPTWAPRSDPSDAPASQASLPRPELCVFIFVKMVIYSNSIQGPKILNSNSSLINDKPYVTFKTWTGYMVQSRQFKCGKSNVDELIMYLMCMKGGSSKEIFYKRSLL